VDEFTGRLMPGRRWSGGLHQAVEAKEKVLVQKESRTLGTITFQNYFRLYEKLAGMTGTAQTSAEEFHKVYKLDVVTVPTNKPMIRHDAPDRIYKSEQGKFLSVAQEIKERHLKGQPVLVGTTSITKNELLAAYLNREGVPHKILNAKNHEQEGEIIAQAGRLGAVTVATNLAGRGVDIILGGNPPNFLEFEEVKKLGGLHVIGTERHEARRIDNQLRGRCGRQGDPGSTQFFISAEDELIRIFGGDRLKNLMERLGVGETEAIENALVSRSIEQAQSKVEGNNFDIRKYVLEYDDVMNKHRTAIYRLRQDILKSLNTQELVTGYIDEVIERLVNFHTAGPDWNRREIEESITALTAKEFKIDEQINNPAVLKQLLYDIASRSYQEKESQLGADIMRQLERAVLLRVIDELWVDHLEQMEYLRDSVRLRAYGQRDPLIEYKIEGQRLFTELQTTIGAQVANLIFKVGRPRPDVAAPLRRTSPGWDGVGFNANGNLGTGAIGRNSPCPCGSGKKWKKCHGK
ncbi:MAG: SEC-C metal-binding domain-containing protein, partial [Patescibacteria group bacterium]